MLQYLQVVNIKCIETNVYVAQKVHLLFLVCQKNMLGLYPTTSHLDGCDKKLMSDTSENVMLTPVKHYEYQMIKKKKKKSYI